MVRDIYGGHLLLFFGCLSYSRPHSRACYNPPANLQPLHTDHSKQSICHHRSSTLITWLTYLQSTWRALSSSLTGFPLPLKFLRIQHHRDHLAAPMDTKQKQKRLKSSSQGMDSLETQILTYSCALAFLPLFACLLPFWSFVLCLLPPRKVDGS